MTLTRQFENYLPLIAVQVLLGLALLAFVFGPWTWQYDYRTVAYLLSAHGSIALFYVVAPRLLGAALLQNATRRADTDRRLTWVKTAIVLAALFAVPTSMARIGVPFPPMIEGILNPAGSYAAAYERSLDAGRWVFVEYGRMVFAPFLVSYLFLTIAFWRELPVYLKAIALGTAFFYVAINLAAGKNRMLGDLLIGTTFALLIAFNYWRTSLLVKISVIAFIAGSQLLLFLGLFYRTQIARAGAMVDAGSFSYGSTVVLTDRGGNGAESAAAPATPSAPAPSEPVLPQAPEAHLPAFASSNSGVHGSPEATSPPAAADTPAPNAASSVNPVTANEAHTPSDAPLPGPTGSPTIEALPEAPGSVVSAETAISPPIEPVIPPVDSIPSDAVAAAADQIRHLAGTTLGPLLGLYESLTRYLTQGYQALAFSLDLDHSSTLGFGNSMFLARNADRLFGTDYFTSQSLPGLLESENGWPYFNLWHSIYPWIASDIGWVGALVAVGLLAGLLSIAWREALKTKSVSAVILSIVCIQILFYIPSSNAILQDGEGFFAFVIALIWFTSTLWQRRFIGRREPLEEVGG